MRTQRILAILAASALALGAFRIASEACGSHDLVDELAVLEQHFGIHTSEIARAHDLRARVDELASSVDLAGLQGDPALLVSTLNELIFNKLRILPSHDL